MPSDDDVVRDLYQIINFGAFANNCILKSTAINARVELAGFDMMNMFIAIPTYFDF